MAKVVITLEDCPDVLLKDDPSRTYVQSTIQIEGEPNTDAVRFGQHIKFMLDYDRIEGEILSERLWNQQRRDQDEKREAAAKGGHREIEKIWPY